jgi:hypothetical protein
MQTASPVHVDEHDIDVAIPCSAVNLLLAQPFVELATPLVEPFTLSEKARNHSASGVMNSLDLACHNNTHFLVLPEFTLPGVAAVDAVKQRLLSADHLKRPPVVIGGVHGLTRDEYAALCRTKGIPVHFHVDNAPSNVGPHEWVNTSVTFITSTSGELSLWIQPKLSPSWKEQNTIHQSMFRGSAINLFRAHFENQVPFRFFSLICFDWIATENGSSIPKHLLRQLNDKYKAQGSPQSVHFAFILQFNEEPNHGTFLGATNDFLSEPTDYPFVKRDNTAIVMACTAGSVTPGRAPSFGYTSVVFGPKAPFDTKTCQPSFSTTLRHKVSKMLGTCKDVVFREMGECAHTATIRIPDFATPNPTDRTAPIAHAEVHPFSHPSNDPRLPGIPVSAVTKWVNDELDSLSALPVHHLAHEALRLTISDTYKSVVIEYRCLPSQDLALKLHFASAVRVLDGKRSKNPAADVETWGATEHEAMFHLIQSIALLGCDAPLAVNGSALHARHTASGTEIAAIRGRTHTDSRKALEKLLALTHSPVVFISRDDDNVGLIPEELKSIVDLRPPSGLKVTDSQTLLSNARRMTADEFREFLQDLCHVADRRII